MSEVSLDRLPPELLYRIFDHLDVCTIIGSVRCVCTRLRAMIKSYYSSELKLVSIENSDDDFEGRFHSSNAYFNILSCLIEPSNITSLIISNGCAGQKFTEMFVKNFNISQFSELRSLVLYNINTTEMSQILQQMTTTSLVSLTIDISERENNALYTIIYPFLQIQTNLKKIDLNKLDYITDEIPWPIQNALEQLTIRDCTYHEYCNILSNSRNLRVLEIRDCIMDNVDEMVSSYSIIASNPAKKLRTTIDSTGKKYLLTNRIVLNAIRSKGM